MHYCLKCGAQNSDNAVTCSNCGAAMTNVSGYNAVQTNETAGKGFAIAGMVCGIVSMLCFPIILGVLAIIFGAVAKNKGYRGGMATAGIVLGAVAIALWLIMLIACGSMIPFMELGRYY